jgi:DNA-binding MarR family transcriptional regulator
VTDPGLADEMAANIRVLLRTFTIDERRFPPAEGQLPYNGADFQAVHFIAEQPGCRSTDLAHFLGLSPTTAQSVIDRLIKRGLVARGPSERDRRAVALTLTNQGEQVCAAIERQDQANCVRMLSVIEPALQADFVKQLSTIAAGMAAGNTDA